METFCVSCKKYAANKNSVIRKTKQNRLMLLSKCAVRGKKKSAFIKNKALINISNYQFKIIKIINKCLLNRNTFMPEFHLKQPRFNYSASGPFTKHRKRI